MLGRCNRRIHYLLSDIERGAFLEYDWRDDVRDIREQFPLDRGVTRVIAAEQNIGHPRDPRTNVDVVMTTDLFVTFADGTERAVACKPAGELGKSRTLEKLEIERRYWSLLGVEWKLWTEQCTTKVRVQNLAYLHEFLDADNPRLVDRVHWSKLSVLFLAALSGADPAMPFAAFASEFEARADLPPGEAVATMRYAACRKLVRFNLDVAFDHSAPLERSLRPLGAASAAKAA